jgi:hypothetical protein
MHHEFPLSYRFTLLFPLHSLGANSGQSVQQTEFGRPTSWARASKASSRHRVSNWPTSSSRSPVVIPGAAAFCRWSAQSPGEREEATACMGDLKKDASFPGGLAFICASLGDREQAFEWLEKSYQEQDAFLVFLPILPEFRSLHGDPRFVDLLRRIGLPINRDVDSKPAEL